MRTNEFQPRSVALVSLFIGSKLPDDQVDFKNDITHFVTGSLYYVPPEDMFKSNNWAKLEFIMHKHIPNINYETDPEWKKEIVDIYIGKTSIPPSFYLTSSG
jgi:hypothetical protein